MSVCMYECIYLELALCFRTGNSIKNQCLEIYELNEV